MFLLKWSLHFFFLHRYIFLNQVPPTVTCFVSHQQRLMDNPQMAQKAYAGQDMWKRSRRHSSTQGRLSEEHLEILRSCWLTDLTGTVNKMHTNPEINVSLHRPVQACSLGLAQAVHTFTHVHMHKHTHKLCYIMVWWWGYWWAGRSFSAVPV